VDLLGVVKWAVVEAELELKSAAKLHGIDSDGTFIKYFKHEINRPKIDRNLPV
jgi:hypothetical protein